MFTSTELTPASMEDYHDWFIARKKNFGLFGYWSIELYALHIRWGKQGFGDWNM